MRLDSRTWVVLPFTNLTRATETAWLSDAAVNLLYLDLSRWSDIRVIDDGRVADAVRALPEAERATIGLATGLSLARQMGAGRLVMGDLVPGRGLTAVVAKVYDVASGNRMRNVREEIASREATLPAFERLAVKVVDLRLPESERRGAVGTTSLEAFQEYAIGLDAMRRWRLDSARLRFGNAIRLDSTFALPHYRLSEVYGWGAAPPGASFTAPAEAAARFASALPARERALIQGRLQRIQDQFADACATFRGLIAADSTDPEAWYVYADCLYDGPRQMRPGPAGTQFLDMRTNSDAYRAFMRALALDPDMHLAYRHPVEMMQFSGGVTCGTRDCRVMLQRQIEFLDDSILDTVALLPPSGIATLPDTGVIRRNLARAEALARRWITAAPSEAQGHLQLAIVLATQRRFTDAVAALAATRRLGTGSAGTVMTHLQTLLPADSVTRRTLPLAVALADSLLRRLEDSAATVNENAFSAAARAKLAALLGQPGRMPRHLFTPGNDTIAGGADQQVLIGMLTAGVAPRDVTRRLESVAGSYADTTFRSPPVGPGPSPFWRTQSATRARTLALTIGYLCHGLCVLPPAMAADSAWGASTLGRLQAGDTVRARVALRQQDSLFAVVVANSARLRTRLDGQEAFRVAIGHLALADTAGAIAALGVFARTLEGTSFGTASLLPVSDPVLLFGRVSLLHADLLAATGRGTEARFYYSRVVDLWSRAEPEYQPLVQRARAALAP